MKHVMDAAVMGADGRWVSGQKDQADRPAASPESPQTVGRRRARRRWRRSGKHVGSPPPHEHVAAQTKLGIDRLGSDVSMARRRKGLWGWRGV